MAQYVLFRTFELDLSEQTGDLHSVDRRPLGSGLHHQLQVVLGELLDQAAGNARRIHVVRRRRQLLLVGPVNLCPLARNLYRLDETREMRLMSYRMVL